MASRSARIKTLLTNPEQTEGPHMWGLLSAQGIFTPAPKGESQARALAEYKFPTTVGPVGEVLHYQDQ